jgi:hypothetical protein
MKAEHSFNPLTTIEKSIRITTEKAWAEPPEDSALQNRQYDTVAKAETMHLDLCVLPFISILSRGNKTFQSTKVLIRMGALMVINYDIKE